MLEFKSEKHYPVGKVFLSPGKHSHAICARMQLNDGRTLYRLASFNRMDVKR